MPARRHSDSNISTGIWTPDIHEAHLLFHRLSAQSSRFYERGLL